MLEPAWAGADNRDDMNIPATPASRIGRRKIRGFTLVELLITVVVLGIIVAVALPSFMDSIRKGRRSEAFAALSALQQAQERWRSNNAVYADTLTKVNIASRTGPGGYYDLDIITNSATGYEVKATAVSGTSQVKDGPCANLSVQVNGGNIKYASCASCTTFTYAASDVCWSR